jgi:ketosteroid isomerase-like protein
MEKETLRKALVEGDLNTLQDLLHEDVEYVFQEKFEVILPCFSPTFSE